MSARPHKFRKSPGRKKHVDNVTILPSPAAAWAARLWPKTWRNTAPGFSSSSTSGNSRIAFAARRCFPGATLRLRPSESRDCLAEAGRHHLNWLDTYVASDLVEHREVVPSTKHQLPFLTCYHPAMQESLLKAAAAAGATVRRGAAVREVRARARRRRWSLTKMAALKRSPRGWWWEPRDDRPWCALRRASPSSAISKT